MSMDSGDQRPARLSTMNTRPPEPEHLPCPRCDSTNTKFCYYNNYNLSQPRHFCKACRRYWTRGGTLRNVPVGGGSRRSASGSSSSSHKRPRTNSSSTSSTANAATTTSDQSSEMTHEPVHANPLSMVSVAGSGPMSGSLTGCDVNLNEAVPEAGNFSSLLTTQMGNGYLPFGSGFGLGPTSGFHGIGFGLGMMDWPMESINQGNGGLSGGGGGGGGGGGVGGGGNNGSGGGGTAASSGCIMWQIGGGVESGLGGDGDCFGWPDLAISMPGKGLK